MLNAKLMIMSRALRICSSVFLYLTLINRASAFQTDLDGQAQMARAAMLARRYPEAVEIYRRMAAELPEEPGIRFNLALALHSMGRYGESTQVLEKLRAAQGENPKFWFLLGEGYLKLGEPRKAIEPLHRASELDPSDANARLELASAWLENGAFEKSEALFRVLTDQHPELPKAWAGLSLSESGLAREKNAPAYAVRAAQSKDRLAALPESAEQHEMLARVFGEAGQQTEAIGELRAAAALDPENSHIQGALARSLVANRQFGEAAALLRILLAKEQDNSDWHFELGDALGELGNSREAIAHLERAVALAPGMLPAQAKLGEALLRSGSPAAAIPHLERAAPLDTDGSLHFQLATAYRRVGKPVLAAKAMARRAEIQSRAQANHN